MKKTTWFLFIGYFLIFVIFGVIFYYKFLNRFISEGAAPEEIQVVSKERIYYSEGNNLWGLNPETSANLVSRSSRIQSTGGVDFTDYNSVNSIFAYSAVNSAGVNDIWQFRPETNQTEKITDSRYEILEDFLNYFKPKYSPTGGRLAFIGRSGPRDTILAKDLTTGNIADLTPSSTTRIIDFSWDSTGQKIIYCTASASPNYCQIQNLVPARTDQKIEVEITQISWQSTSEIIYLSMGNIFRLKEGEVTPTPITSLVAPKKVVGFNLDPEAKLIAYQINEATTNNIYLVGPDGTNNFELTSTGDGSEPILSPDGSQVAYLRPDGIYTIDAYKTDSNKILNAPPRIDHLLAWR